MARSRNIMKELKRDDAGFFIWVYYPKEQHEKEVIASWLEAVGINENSNMINIYYSQGYIDIMTPYHKDTIKIEDINIDGLGTSGFSSDIKTFGPSFDRENMVSLYIQDYYSKSAYKTPSYVEAFFHYFDLFVSHFQPIFAFGHIDFNKWCDTHYKSPPPEIRVWPYNLYNLNAYDVTLKDHLDLFFESHKDTWSMRRITDGIIELRVKDLYTPESEIGPEVTYALLGQGDNLLVPKIGYPPPERWW